MSYSVVSSSWNRQAKVPDQRNDGSATLAPLFDDRPAAGSRVFKSHTAPSPSGKRTAMESDTGEKETWIRGLSEV